MHKYIDKILYAMMFLAFAVGTYLAVTQKLVWVG